MVGFTAVIGLSCLAGAIILGLSLDSTRATFWTLSTVLILLAQIAIFEPFKVFLLAVFWATSRKNVPK